MKRILLTVPLFYTNGNLHIGHKFTIYIAAYYAEFYKQQNYKVSVLGGTDEHGSKSKTENIPYYRKNHGGEFIQALGGRNLSLYFVNTRSFEAYKNFCFYFDKIQKSCKLKEFNYSYSYNDEDEEFTPGEDNLEKSLELDISQFWYTYPFLRQNSVYQKETDQLKHTLYRKINLTRNITNSFKFTYKSHVYGIYVWFDAILSYLATGEIFDCTLHIFGKDILRFHTYVLGSLFKAAGDKSCRLLVPHGWILNDKSEKIGKRNTKDCCDTEYKYDDDVLAYIFYSNGIEKDKVFNQSIYDTAFRFYYRVYLNLYSRILGMKKISEAIVRETFIQNCIEKEMHFFTRCINFINQIVIHRTQLAADLLVSITYRYRNVFRGMGEHFLHLSMNNNTLSISEFEKIKQYAQEQISKKNEL